MKVIKIVFSIIGLLIIISVLAVCSVIYFVDPGKLKPVIIAEVKKETGYVLSIEGDLSWSFYPRISVKIQHLLIYAPDQKQPFIDAQDVRMAADLMALLHSTEKLQGDIWISSIQLATIHAENVSATLNWENKTLILNPIKAFLYEGTLEGTASGRDFNAIPHWEWSFYGQGLQMKPLLQDMNGGESKMTISGIGSVKLQAETSGHSREQMLRKLNGSSEFSLINGAVEGIDLNYFIQAANALLNEEATTEPVNSKKTEFSQLTGSVIIKNGIVDSNNMLLTAPAFTAKAQGTIELVSRTLDFNIQVKPQLENAKIHWQIPVVVTGDLNHPEMRLDRMEIQGMLAGKELEKIKQKAVQEINKHVHGKAREILQNLLGSD